MNSQHCEIISNNQSCPTPGTWPAWLLTSGTECPLLAISGRSEGSAITSALPPKADIKIAMSAFRLIMSAYPPIADLMSRCSGCPLMTQSGHWWRRAQILKLFARQGSRTRCRKVTLTRLDRRKYQVGRPPKTIQIITSGSSIAGGALGSMGLKKTSSIMLNNGARMSQTQRQTIVTRGVNRFFIGARIANGRNKIIATAEYPGE